MNREDFMKMKKIAAIIVGSILFLSVAVFIMLKFMNPTIGKEANEKEYEGQQFLKEQKLGFYISNEAKSLEEDKTKGYVLFLDKNNNITEREIQPVEYGGITFANNRMMVEESNQMTLTEYITKKTTFEKPDYRGMHNGYLPKTEQYYSLYNSGLSEKHDYKMTVRYAGEDGQFKKFIIPKFVSAAGEEGAQVIVLTQDLISGAFQLQQTPLEEKAKLQKITDLNLKSPMDLDAIAPILVTKKAYYLVMSRYVSESYEDIMVYEVNRKTKDVKATVLAKYRSEKETTSSLPLSFNDSATTYKGGLYYLNGMGQVYRYDLKTKQIEKILKLKDQAKDKNHMQAVFYEGKLHIVYVKNGNTYYDQYHLKKKKRVQHQEIKNIERYLKNGAMISDLTIIK